MQAAALALAFSACVSLPAQAQEAAEVEIVEHGIYTAEIESTVREPTGVGRNVVGNICHVATTKTIPMRYGIHFGIRYKAIGPAKGEVVDLKKVVVFPTAMRPPGAPRPLSTYEYPVRLAAGTVTYTGYSFDHPWEFVPGPWTMQIWQGNQRRAEIVFNVVDGAEAPTPRTGNANCFRISSLSLPGARPSSGAQAQGKMRHRSGALPAKI